MSNRARLQRGNSVIEFTLVAIPLILVLISTFEIARAMWSYQTLAYAVKDAARYASTHGNGCTSAVNSCGITVGTVASRIRTAGTGLDAGQLSVTLTDNSGSVSCPTLTSCLSSNTAWPTTLGGGQGSNLTVTGTYQFRSALSMFWPGAGSVRFGTVTFPAAARETVQF